MNQEILKINKGEWLTEALEKNGYEGQIPTNVILDKTLTGLGATHSELYAKRNSIIIEPNVPVILCKLENDDISIEGVYERPIPMPLRKYLKSDKIPYKKILTTPESFYKIKNMAEKEGINIYGEDWFCLFDECEKITQDHDYRPAISYPIADFFRFQNKAMVSATPLLPSDPEFEKQGFRKLKIQPEYDYRKELSLVITNSLKTELTKKIEELAESRCICIFLNKTDSIEAMIDELVLEDYKIFCSEKSVKKLNKRGIFQAYSNIEYPLAKYNFFTCRFYSGLDIRLNYIKPDIIMVTDFRMADFTMIDPVTEAIQIYGRFRKEDNDDRTVNSFTHISNIKPNMTVYSIDEINRMIEQERDNYNNLKISFDIEEDEVKKGRIKKDMDNLSYSNLLNQDGTVNYFAIDNRYNEERVKGYYLSPDSLVRAYDSTNQFNINPEIRLFGLGEDELFRVNNSKSIHERRVLIAEIIEALEERNPTDKEMKNQLQRLQMLEDGLYMVSVYRKIGLEGIKKCNYSKTSMDNAVKSQELKEAEHIRFSPQILKIIKEAFELNRYIPKKELQAKLKRIYEENGIKYKVRQTTITDYFDTQESNSKEEPSYKLLAFKVER